MYLAVELEMTGPNLYSDANPSGSRDAISLAIESFVGAARASDVLGAGAIPLSPADNYPVSEFFAGLRRFITRAAAAAKSMEMPAAGPNPARVGRWLETRFSHIALVFSPLTERAGRPARNGETPSQQYRGNHDPVAARARPSHRLHNSQLCFWRRGHDGSRAPAERWPVEAGMRSVLEGGRNGRYAYSSDQ